MKQRLSQLGRAGLKLIRKTYIFSGQLSGRNALMSR